MLLIILYEFVLPYSEVLLVLGSFETILMSLIFHKVAKKAFDSLGLSHLRKWYDL